MTGVYIRIAAVPRPSPETHFPQLLPPALSPAVASTWLCTLPHVSRSFCTDHRARFAAVNRKNIWRAETFTAPPSTSLHFHSCLIENQTPWPPLSAQFLPTSSPARLPAVTVRASSPAITESRSPMW
ncbi:hypothetical protein BCR34DRAFT_55332 [Clohesyomyces aquaticus]|uniref:Uncharacterized protein n=1 Tax=Clohesyomyces aquaticus TaxID=1231657 RepID=A0A1Y1Z2P6_9PLEO|nr:hypothetical protein BCR34DRAFT_55332 [Clohesyomyces aquaticus]